MKYLKGYKLFESNIDESIIYDIKDILLEFNDNGIKVEVLNKDKTIVMIGEEESNNYIKLKEYKETLSHFFRYLKEVGLSINKSFITNESWDAEIICPECSSYDIYLEHDYGICNNCKIDLDSFEFYSDEHILDLSELNYYIKNNYWCQFLFIELTKS